MRGSPQTCKSSNSNGTEKCGMLPGGWESEVHKLSSSYWAIKRYHSPFLWSEGGPMHCQIDKSSFGESSWHNRQYYPSNLSLNGCIKYAFHSSSLVHYNNTGVLHGNRRVGNDMVWFGYFSLFCNKSQVVTKMKIVFISPKAKHDFPPCRRRLFPLAVSRKREREREREIGDAFIIA